MRLDASGQSQAAAERGSPRLRLAAVRAAVEAPAHVGFVDGFSILCFTDSGILHHFEPARQIRRDDRHAHRHSISLSDERTVVLSVPLASVSLSPHGAASAWKKSISAGLAAAQGDPRCPTSAFRIISRPPAACPRPRRRADCRQFEVTWDSLFLDEPVFFYQFDGDAQQRERVVAEIGKRLA